MSKENQSETETITASEEEIEVNLAQVEEVDLPENPEAMVTTERDIRTGEENSQSHDLPETHGNNGYVSTGKKEKKTEEAPDLSPMLKKLFPALDSDVANQDKSQQGSGKKNEVSSSSNDLDSESGGQATQGSDGQAQGDKGQGQGNQGSQGSSQRTAESKEKKSAGEGEGGSGGEAVNRKAKATIGKTDTSESVYTPKRVEATRGGESQQQAEQPKFEEIPDDLATFIKESLGEDSDELMQIETLEYHGKKSPKEYGKLAKETAEFYKLATDHIAAKEAEAEQNGDTYDLKEDTEYQKLLREKAPKITAGKIRRLRDDMIRDQASDHAYERFQKDSADIRKQVSTATAKPEVEKKLTDVRAKFGNALLPDDIQAVVKDKGEDAAQFELHHAKPIIDSYSKMAEEYTQLVGRTMDMKDSKYLNQIEDYIGRVQDTFISQGKGLVREGKKFIRLEDLPDVPAEDRDKVWYFKPEQIVESMEKSAKRAVANQIKVQQDLLQKAGFSRNSQSSQSSGASGGGVETTGRNTVGSGSRSSGSTSGGDDGNQKKGIISRLVEGWEEPIQG